ncbi:S8 family serine peptidase [Streptomyces sp. CNQ085]|uniref:S8 family serine peptidase n=1 Tax=Streptomyces sp. CNQ085 TaxID=2886944 RepID=UPI001F50C7F8|nr:S8 family serine peptidase [Streptomyces sp. CNQ085]MCI0384625.1 S8 family serine peptidase [Streptomyces sp. CNQ085]
MASRPSSRRRAVAVPVGLALTASLALLPGAGTALAQETGTPAPVTAAADGGQLSYVVNTSSHPGTIRRVEREIAKAGGTVVVTHREIGVIVAHSADSGFAERMREVRGVHSAGATRTAPLKAAGTTEVGAPQYVAEAARTSAATAASEGEPMEADLWGLRAIRADEAAKVNPGSDKVTVAVIDTGVDDTHPDLAPNFSARQSANCVGGVADTSEGAWRPYTDGDYHGTHVAGSIAAARNGVGVAGVAPGVKVSSIKVSEPDTSLFYPEAVICAFVFAADKGVEITNNSYYVDPYLYNCEDDADQGAVVEALRRASRHAERRGTLHIASAGNSNHDLASDAILDASSPNDTTPVERTIDPSECLDLPTQLPGVVTVTATGVQDLKSYYSSYGHRVADVAAPGGDRFQIPDTPSGNGRILSTMPNDSYAFLQGTSMASPHVAGVAALLKSKHPWASPAMLQLMMKAQADNPGCPETYDPDGNGVEDSTCEGGKRVNGFYGYGIVDALDAVE